MGGGGHGQQESTYLARFLQNAPKIDAFSTANSILSAIREDTDIVCVRVKYSSVSGLCSPHYGHSGNVQLAWAVFPYLVGQFEKITI